MSRSNDSQAPDEVRRRLRLVYDGNCPTCRRYVRWQRIRREPETFDLSDASGVVLHVRGDSRRYQLRLRTDKLFDGGAYRALFQPSAGEWQRVTLPWSEFEAVFRGRRLENAPPLDPEAIQQVGFLIADRRPGPFRFEVAWLQALSGEPTTPTGNCGPLTDA